MSLNKRCMHILLFIISQDKPVKISQLKEIYKVSERTIRYDLDEIEYWLSKQGFGKLEIIYSEGITISCNPDNRTRIIKLFEGKIPNDYFYSAEERQKIILLELLNADQPIRIEYLQKKLSLSRGTVIKELKVVDNWLSKYKLTLLRKPNYGMEIQGEEASKRNALLGIAKDFMTTEQILSMISAQENNSRSYDSQYKKYGIRQDKILFNIDLALLEESINKLQDLLGAQLGDNSFASLFTHLAIALQRIKAGKSIFLPHEELVILENTDEFKIAANFSSLLEKNFNMNIPISEIGYITLHILGVQLQKASDDKQNNAFITQNKELNTINFTAKDFLSKIHEFDYFEMAKDITGYVKKILNIEFKDDYHLLIDLCTHLKPAVHRCKYNMPLTNPWLDDIKKNYYRVFLIVREAFLMLKVKYPFEINDHELSYIALHFAAEIEKEKVLYYKRLNVLLICASGIGTAKMLYNRLTSNFKDLNVVNTVSYLEFLKKDDWNVDLVISTINIKSGSIPCIVVNPLLNEEDLLKIEEYMLSNAVKQTKERKQIPVINSKENALFEENTSNDDSNQNSEQILESNRKQDHTDFRTKSKASLSDLLTSGSIKLDVDAYDWEESIELGADILLQQNLIEPRYISSLKDTIRSIGPYIVIAPGIAFSHSKPEDGVKGLGMSLIRLKNPVAFGNKENDPVKLIFTLAPLDDTSHHKALSHLMKILLNKKDMDVFFSSSNIEAILECISIYSKQNKQ